jgi:hypothetical protein
MAETWQKRSAISLPCPSGAVCEVRRPSPALSIKAGKLSHVFALIDSRDSNGNEEISDEESERVYLFARQVVLECVINPKLSAEWSTEELTPEDIPPKDFWRVFRWAMTGGKGMPVTTEEGETTVEAVETFPDEQTAVNIPGSNGEPISQVAV